MRRTTAAIAGTLSGAALLLAAKYGADAASVETGQVAGETGDLGAASPAPGAAGNAPAGNGAGGNGTAGNGAAGNGAAGNGTGGNAAGGGNGATGNAPSGNTPARAANGMKDGVFRGAAARNQYGPVQVTIRVAGGRITGLTATTATSPAMTAQVNGRAIPLLRQSALTAQSAQVDAVSGATFTTGSFRTSLQSALAAARA
ncbi:FMN-binding protein [Spirillospora sp. NPDC048911]|uniref:FMN-binding protein n=1 Tax=Spirillospora sp. NPDC048911 TaxID=3364527 RepID=UPI00372438D5